MNRLNAMCLGVVPAACLAMSGCAGNGVEDTGPMPEATGGTTDPAGVDVATPEPLTGDEAMWSDIVAAIGEHDSGTPASTLPSRGASNDATASGFDPGATPRETPVGAPTPVAVDDAPATPGDAADEAPAPPEETSAQRVARLTAELASSIGISASTSDDPVREAVRLVLLEATSPGAPGDPGVDGLGTELGHVLPLLTPPEREAVDRLRGLLSSLKQAGPIDAARLARTLREEADSMAADRPVTIPTVALCRSVDRFGVYSPFTSTEEGTYRFLAGRSQRTIVYVEVEDFAFERGVAGGGWEVELSMEATLVRRADSVLARRVPPTTVREVTRRPIRDLFLRTMFELPPTLTVGLYDLKVTIRDRNDDGAIAERLVPIEIVADRASLAGGE